MMIIGLVWLFGNGSLLGMGVSLSLIFAPAFLSFSASLLDFWGTAYLTNWDGWGLVLGFFY